MLIIFSKNKNLSEVGSRVKRKAEKLRRRDRGRAEGRRKAEKYRFFVK